MYQLIATGPEPGQTFSRALPAEATVRLGRAPRKGWRVPWDLYISREHADIRLDDDRLHVKCTEGATNLAYVDDAPTSEFSVGVGETFRIGKTNFELSRIEFHSPPEASIVERSFNRLQLHTHRFKDAHHQLEVLGDLPAVISMAATDQEFGRGLVGLLLAGIPHAEAAAVAKFQLGDALDGRSPAQLSWDVREGGDVRFRPSHSLIKTALTTGETTLHVWAGAGESDPNYTADGNLDWAFCTPIVEQSEPGWCLYVTGSLDGEVRSEDDLTGDVRFAELIAQTTGAILRVRNLEQRHAGLRQFFSPAVMEALSGPDAGELLRPTLRDITVLFCDIRGFSRAAEESAHDLEALMRRTSDALGLMTHEILARDGVIADFQGDAALAFWGWPLPPEDGPLPACAAALAIQHELEQARDDEKHPLYGFRVGIGIAHGQAIAGKIGSPEQAKVGVLGPVVNLGARLEAMTKQLGASILMDEATAQFARDRLAADEGRCRRMGNLLPYGMSAPLNVSQLLPAKSAASQITAAGIADFEAAVDAVAAGDWPRALEWLEEVPGPDRAKDFLTVFIANNNYEPPEDWKGVIKLPRK